MPKDAQNPRQPEEMGHNSDVAGAVEVPVLNSGEIMKKLLAVLLFVSLSVVAAEKVERPDITINDVDTQELSAPLYQGEDGDDTLYIPGIPLYSSREKKWFRISVDYETRPDWIDRLTLEFYVLLPGREEEPILFKGEVSYVDIPEGRKHLAEMYMHFNSYERYYRRGKVRTAVLAKVDGEIVAIDDRNSLDDKWWENIPLHPCGLLNRLDTPFRVVNAGNYEAQDSCSWE